MNISFAHLWFKFIHQNFLIYNMCWEDAKVDRSLLNLDSESKVMMISSAGCNALSYLLDQPNIIHSVDINPRQTALLDLKIQLIKSGFQNTFYEFFWDGKSENYKTVYKSIKPTLGIESQHFWNDHIHYFDPNGAGLFFQGGSGSFARFLNKIIDRKNLRSQIIELSKETDITKRGSIFSKIEQILWTGIDRLIWPSNVVLSIAGIPDSQQKAIGDLNSFTKKVIHQIFVNQIAHNNPYWGRYLNLSELTPRPDDIHHIDNFEILMNNIHRISHETMNFNHSLEQSTQYYSHFVLLDHMDWMVAKHKNELNKLWDLITEKSESNAKILFRTAFSNLDFLPKSALEAFHFKEVSTEWLSKNDRVGTYTGTYVGVKK